MSNALRERLIALKSIGTPWPQVIFQMKTFGCHAHQRTLSRIWSAYLNEGRTSQKHRSGRPPKCSSRDERQVVREALRDRRTSLKRIATTLTSRGLNLSRNTVARILKSKGFKRRSICSRPALNARQKQARLQWAQEHRYWKVCH